MSIAGTWLRRYNRRMMVVMMVLLALPAIGASVWFVATGDPRAFMLMIAMTLANVVNIINPITFRRLKRRVRERRGRLCTACLFPLEGLGDAGTCPECGTDYDIASTIESWKRDLAMHKDPALSAGDTSKA